jgi:hypothetical protein
VPLGTAEEIRSEASRRRRNQSEAGTMNEQLRERILGDTTLARPSPWTHRATMPPAPGADPAAERPRVELVGMQLRVAGELDLGDFSRLTDFVNARDSFELRDAVLLAGFGQETRYTFHELRVRLADIAIIGQREGGLRTGDGRHRVHKRAPRVVVMTLAHVITGAAYLHPEASLSSLIEADQRFMPMTDVRVRWLPDRGMAARYPFALIQRNHIIGVAIEPVPVPAMGNGHATHEPETVS